jgi:uridylate kinase
LEKGRVVIFASGIGNAYFSTDTTAALRAAEIEAEIILLAKKVDGVYDCDPVKNINAKKFETITYIDVINKGLGVMDSTAASLCKDNNIPILVFDLKDPDNIIKAIMGEKIGTIVKEECKND